MAAPFVVLATAFSARSESRHWGDYQLNSIAQAWFCLVVTAPLLAAWAAWETARLRPWLSTHWGGQTQLRSLATAVLIPISVTMALVLVTVVLAAGVPATGRALAFSVAALTTMVAAALTGMASGVAAPRVFAAPAVLLLWYAWLATPMSRPGSWVSSATVTGSAALCCTSSTEVSGTAIAVALVVNVLWSLGAVACIVMGQRTGTRGSVLAGATALGLGAGWVLGSAGPSTGLQPRTSPLTCTLAANSRVCVWPENRRELSMVAAAVDHARTVTATDGIELPRTWSESHSHKRHVVVFAWVGGLVDDQHMWALAVDVANHVGCGSSNNAEAVMGFLALEFGAHSQWIPVTESPAFAGAARAHAAGGEAAKGWFVAQVQQCSQ
jgi:hypothetical protein